MSTVFSYIVQKRYSRENENIATEALTFIVQSSEKARSGLMRLLRGITPDLPSLQFRTQQSKNGSRPDMGGYDVITPRVFIENKFWAGLTDNQPVEYLTLLAECAKPTVLLVVVPEARQETVWRELLRRLSADNVSTSNREPSAGTYRIVETDSGPVLALTSWAKLLSAIEVEIADEPQPLNDLRQLRALCDAADSDAFVPLSCMELTDQRTPAFILQLNSIVQKAVALSITEDFLSINGLRPTSSWEQIGRYISFPTASGVVAWIGTDFRRWKECGRTPLWLKFPPGKWGRAPEVQVLLEPWADREGIAYTADNEGMTVGIDLVASEEMDLTVKSVVNFLRNISTELSGLPRYQG